jgi:hypothetical protein
MKYLVLRPFRSYGIPYNKGDIVDEKDIRSPYLRRSEGKIVPAVSSANVPDVEDQKIQTPAQSTEDDNIGAKPVQPSVAPFVAPPEKFDIVDETNTKSEATPVVPVFTFTAPSN